MCAVLIVEDHGDTRRTLASLLRNWGHAVSIADNVTSAVECIEHKLFDVILSDINLPDGDGYEFIAEIKKRQIPSMTAALTALTSEADVQDARRAGFDYHFAKPVDLQRLRSLLEIAA